jgi:diguanylate cyclase (GGDEF)-like protein/putative nucleotidyltransferase with HDIG domain
MATTAHRRTPLLAIVYGVSASLILASTVGLVWVAGEQVLATALRSTIAADQATIRSLPISPTPSSDLDVSRITDTELEALAAQGLTDLSVLSRTGRVLLGDARSLGSPALDDDLARALDGESRATILPATPAGGRPVLVEHLPLLAGGSLVGVVRVHRDPSSILADVATTRASMAAIAIVGAVLLAALLFLIFRAAQRRLGIQALQLAEAARRDPVTGLLNHGAIVEHLAHAIESSEQRDPQVGIALIDIDNFRLLNETHGHANGDFVLRKLAHELELEGSETWTAGRYGPDEFLAVAGPGTARELESRIERLRKRLDGTAVALGDAEPLPVSISVGIAHFPWHASSMIDLLSAATVALGEAKAGGGGGVRTAGEWDDETKPGRGHFDVFRGLVFAVDTKDRYTKRHSEDVATYAAFLARQLGLDAAMVDTVRTAGLLHDVGKIGVPDDILRKPGKLTAHEYDIVKQHVVLGDLIVRDLPASWLIRAGIRHHHERWDGTGYVDELAGEAIPLIARVLAVADAFSAMTTSRPYRKALGTRDALRQIEDSAGTQLDAELAGIFVSAMETAPDAPLPEFERDRLRIWTPSAA